MPAAHEQLLVPLEPPLQYVPTPHATAGELRPVQ